MITNKKRILSVAAAPVMLLSVTGAILLNSPGPGPGGATAYPSATIEDQADVADGPETNDVSSEQGGSDRPAVDDGPQEDVSALTTISACKTATGFWESTTVYDWSVEKTILGSEGVEVSEDGSYASVELLAGETVTVQYQMVAERIVASESDVMGVRGYVRVTNTGLWPTENLEISDHVRMSSGCGYEDVAVFEVDTSAHPVLCPGESYCYPYEHEFEAARAA